MADTTPSRRSARGRVPNKRYTNDAFEGLDLEGTALVSSSSSEATPQPDEQDPELNGEDEEFAAAEVISSSSEDESANAIPEPETSSESETFQDVEDSDDGSATPTPGEKSGEKSKSQAERLKTIAGNEQEDLEAYVKNYMKWSSEHILPTRLADNDGTGGLAYPSRPREESHERDSAEAWEWYYERGGQEAMRQKQDIQPLTENEAKEFYPERLPEHTVLMGPYGRQSEFKLPLNSALHLYKTWPSTSSAQTERTRRTLKDGWLINLGSNTRSIAWAPSQPGSTQYLAVALHSKPPPDHPPHSAFQPSLPWKSSVDIWAFGVDPGPKDTGYLAASSPPRVVHSICTTWGQPRLLKWCPIARFPRESLVSDGLAEGIQNVSIGVLAGIWTDGYARVLDVRVPVTHDQNHAGAYYHTAAFTAKLPDRVCSTLAWRSDREIIVGLSSGEIAVWDISASILSLDYLPFDQSSTQTNHIPAPTILINHTPKSWPLTIVSLTPSLPNIFATSTLSGHVFLVDLNDPHGDIAHTPRTRLPLKTLVWHDVLFGMLQADDEQVEFKALRSWSSWTTMIVAMQAEVTCLSTGKAHQSVLVGDASGEAVVTAPWRRIFTGKGGEKLTWFKHEWIPLRPPANTLPPDSSNQPPAHPPTQFPAELPLRPSPNSLSPDPSNQPPAQSPQFSAQLPLRPSSSSLSPDPSNQPPAQSPTQFSVQLPLRPSPNASSPDPSNQPPAQPPTQPPTQPPAQLPPAKPILRPGISRITEGYRPQRVDKRREKIDLGKTKPREDPVIWTTIYEEESAVTQIEWNPNAHVGGWAAAGTGCGMLRVEDLAI